MTEQQPDLSDLITRVCDGVKTDAAYVEQKASILRATADTSSSEEFSQLGGECGGLVHKAQAAHQELTSAGVQDWVYSVKACEQVVFHAHEAMAHAMAAAQSEYPTEIHGYLDSCVHSLQNATYAINGA